MSQKINPTSLRTGIIKDWTSRWLPKKFKFGKSLQEDFIIRTTIEKKIAHAGIDSIVIEKNVHSYKVLIKVAKPGLVIGRGGKGVEELNALVEKKLKDFKKKNNIKEAFSLSITIEEIKRFDVSAQVIAQNIAWDFEKRMPYRKTIKKYIERIMQNRDIRGTKIKVGGRLDGAEIARSEQLSSGNLPLQTLRANIDYGQATAFTTFGTIGIKVWIYKGEVFKKEM